MVVVQNKQINKGELSLPPHFLLHLSFIRLFFSLFDFTFPFLFALLFLLHI